MGRVAMRGVSRLHRGCDLAVEITEKGGNRRGVRLSVDENMQSPLVEQMNVNIRGINWQSKRLREMLERLDT